MKMIEWNFIIIGALIALISIRLFKGFFVQFVYFGVIFAVIEGWKYWFVPFLGLPELSNSIYQLGAGIYLSWLVYRGWVFVVHITNDKTLKDITKLIFGRVEKLRMR